jgi:hypothetical protein
MGRMHKAYSNLVNLWDYYMPDDLAVAGVFRSLPPSYEDHVRKIVMRGDPFTFNDIMGKLNILVVAPTPVEIIDDDGKYIFDICIIIVILTNAYCRIQII